MSTSEANPPSLSKLLARADFPKLPKSPNSPNSEDVRKHELRDLQLKMLRIQQGIWHRKKRAILVLEGIDAAGKGGTIRRLIETLDPRGYRVHAIGPPGEEEQAKHYLYRFWVRLPAPGTIAVFDRSWYGRLLVERVRKLAPVERWKAAFREIVEFERQLTDDGVDLVKLFLAIDKAEQLVRFEKRLSDPYKRWKLNTADVEARAQWDAYVEASDDALAKTHVAAAPWHLIAANDKDYARREALSIVTERLAHHGRWLEDEAAEAGRTRTLEAELQALGLKKGSLR